MAADGLNEFRLLESNTLTDDLVTFIEKELPTFPASHEFIHVLEKKKNENQHSLSFCLYMTNKCNSKFYFARENSQKGSSVIDIGIYHGHALLFTIEAKLLPTPIVGKKSKRAEHEYVYGKGGGIQRFKDGFHGRDNNDCFLPENGIIAFIKEDSFDYWLGKINQWIVDASWGTQEGLKKIYFNTVGKLKSMHGRIDGQKVILHHFWINT